MAIAPNKWPDILTNKDWQKKKGPFAKAAGETGVGRRMDYAQRTWARIDFERWNKPSATKFNGNRIDDAAIAAKVKQMGEYLEDFVPDTQQMLKQLAKLASETSAEWKKSKLIPASATKHAWEVARTAAALADALDPKSAGMKHIAASYEKGLRARKNA